MWAQPDENLKGTPNRTFADTLDGLAIKKSVRQQTLGLRRYSEGPREAFVVLDAVVRVLSHEATSLTLDPSLRPDNGQDDNPGLACAERSGILPVATQKDNPNCSRAPRAQHDSNEPEIRIRVA
jgi:hypothetical protein